jgi:hypothetical protein
MAIGPNVFLAPNQERINKAIAKIDKGLKAKSESKTDWRTHNGTRISVIITDSLNLAERQAIAQRYVDAGWKSVTNVK